MTTKSYNIEGIGRVDFTRRKGSGRISLRVKNDGVVKVNYPYIVSIKEALKFLESNKSWVHKQLEKVEQKKTCYEIGTEIKTRHHTINIISTPEAKTYGSIKNGNAVICISELVDIKSEAPQAFIQKVIAEVYRTEAKAYLPQRVAQLATQFRFTYRAVFIKRLKSKWGSCSQHKNINLNVYLMALPDELIDYIILHELCHTVHLNHGTEFWNLMEKVCNGKAKALNKAMKQYRGVIDVGDG